MMDSSLPDAAPEQGAAQEGLCASLVSLQVNGTPPAVGDSVQVTVEGKISSIEGDHAYIEPEKVNGEDVPAQDDQVSPEDGQSALEKKAAQLDSQQGY